jgi:hypothetical protein
MSARYSAASVASTSDSSVPACAPHGSASKKSSANESSRNTGRAFPATETCESSQEPQSSQLTCSAEDSPARTSATPARERESTERARVFGQSTPVSLASFDPATSSWRTSQLSLLEAWDEFSETWPRSGMTRSGTAYQLQPLAPLTRGIASGLLPTPVAHDDGKTPEAHMAMKRRMPGGERKTITSLAVLARNDFTQPDGQRIWPTPKSSPSGPDYARMNRESSGGDDLATAVAREMWATPKATDADRGGRGDLIQQVRGNESPSGHFKTPTSAPFSHGGSGGELHKQVAPSGGPLNPPWVAWLMGFPIDWTSLPPSATRSSRRSRSGSAGESSNGKD